MNNFSERFVWKTPPGSLEGLPDRKLKDKAAFGESPEKTDENSGSGGGAQALQKLSAEVAVEKVGENVSENADLLTNGADFQKRFGSLKKKFGEKLEKGGFEKLSEEERKDLVLSLRRKIDEMKFLINYVYENFAVEFVNGNSMWVFGAEQEQKVNITEAEKYIQLVESKLREVTVSKIGEGGQKEEYSFYEDIEKTRNTIKPKDFFKFPIDQRLQLVTNVKSWDKLRDGTLVVIDFGANEDLEYQVGLGDLMPPAIRAIGVDGAVYERRGNQGFYDGGEYLPIFNGSKVTISKRDDSYSEAKEFASKFSDIGESYEKKNILEVAQDFGVDAHLLDVLLAAVGRDDERAISDPEEFLHIAARYIQNAERKYEAEKGTCMESGRYKVDFLVYALDRFNLFNFYSARDEAVISSVVEQYGKLRGIDLKFSDEMKEKRKQEVPREYSEVVAGGYDGFRGNGSSVAGGGGAGPGSYGGEVRYEAADISRSTSEMKERMKKRLEKLYDSLIAKGVPPEKAKMVHFYAEKIFAKMLERAGTMYKSKVPIRSLDGHSWSIWNSCVGNTMKVAEGLPLGVLRGRQAGWKGVTGKGPERKGMSRAYIDDFYWGSWSDTGREEDYLKSIVAADNRIINERLTPQNADYAIGRHLAVGEPAVISFRNHVGWVYKDFDGRVMLFHSGADVRPRTVHVSPGGEIPPGYQRESGTTCRRIPGSKANEIPLSYFMANMQKSYGPGRNEVRIIPLSTLVSDNLADAVRGKEVAAFYERNNGERLAQAD